MFSIVNQGYYKLLPAAVVFVYGNGLEEFKYVNYSTS